MPRRRTAVGLLAVVGCLFLASAARPADDPSAAPAVRRRADPVPADGPAVRVSGVVVTPAGKPVPGATVVLRAPMFTEFYRDVLARTTTDTAGRFAFDRVGIPPRLTTVISELIGGHPESRQGGVELLAWADGWGLTWAPVRGLAPAEPVRLALAPEAKVAGVVRDKAGTGAAGVRVAVDGVTRAAADEDRAFQRSEDLRLVYSEVSPEATTDAAGRFTLAHLPPGCRIAAYFERPGLTARHVYIDTGERPGPTEVRSRRGGQEVVVPVQRPPLSLSLEPQRFARVKVVDAAGRPVGGGRLEMIDSRQRFAGRSLVDERGEAHVAIPNPGPYRLRYVVDPLDPRLATVKALDVAPGEGSPLIELRLPEARWLSGRVVDADTGKGVVGAHVAYARQRDPESKEAPATSECISGRDGEFRLPVATGRGRVRLLAVFGYHGAPRSRPGARAEADGKLIDVPQSGRPEPVTLSLSRGLAVRGVVRDGDGKPVPGAVVYVQAEVRPPIVRVMATTDAEGHFLIPGLPPRASATLLVKGESGVGQVRIDAAPEHPPDRTRWQEVEVRLKSGVVLTGRVLYKGRPRAGVAMKLHRGLGNSRYSFSFGETRTDTEGRFRVSGLEAGDQFYFEIVDADGMTDPAWRYQSPQTIPRGRAEIGLPDIQLTTTDQSLRGVVVDPKGKPVPGITVSARLAGGRGLSRRPGSGPPPWTKTDAQGRFELRRLPDLPIQLIAYRANPEGGLIRYPSVARPALNDQAIRIVFDPSLGEENVENLDAPRRAAERAAGRATGTWKASFTTPGGQKIPLMYNTFWLKQDGEKLTGSARRNGREVPMEDGTVKDGKVSFTLTQEQPSGRKLTYRFKGELKGDTITGKLEVGEGVNARSFDWEARRQ